MSHANINDQTQLVFLNTIIFEAQKMTWECMQMLMQNTVLDHSNHIKKFTVQMVTRWQLALGS